MSAKYNKKFVVIGLGRFGFHVAVKLAEEGQDVLAIDHDQSIISQIKDLAPNAVIADAADREALRSLGVHEADIVVISLGDKLDRAITTLLYLKEFEVPYILIKANTEDQGKIFEMMGADEVVYPEREVGLRVGERLSNPNVLERMVFAKNHSIAEIIAPQSFVGSSLKDLGVRNNYGVVVAAIRKKDGADIDIAPSPFESIEDGDILVVVGRDEDIDKLKRV